MFTDAHVHMGYYSRKGFREPFYYSPRRVLGVLDRCGIDEFIVSSTCAQVASISIRDLNREAREMKRLAGDRAHIFFWLSGHLFEEDPKMSWMDGGLFEGVKFHEKETPWFSCRRAELRGILDCVAERGLPVQFHTGADAGCRPLELASLAKDYSSVRFDFAHCRLLAQSAAVLAECPNVYVDTAYFDGDFSELRGYEWRGRLMYGSDLPVWQAQRDVSLTAFYRKNMTAFYRTFPSNGNILHEFLYGKKDVHRRSFSRES